MSFPARKPSRLAVAALVLVTASAQSLNAPIQVAASPDSFGPDGPWNAARVYIGDPQQAIDLYPTTHGITRIFSPDICNYETPDCVTKDGGGVYDNTTSTSVIFEGVAADDSDYSYVLDTMSFQSGDLSGQSVVPNTTFAYFTFYAYQYPNNRFVNPYVGLLDIGDPYYNFTGINGETGNYTGNSPPQYLWENKLIPSASYGLHLGSALPDTKISLSLFYGGYDPSRIIGKPIANPNVLPQNADNFQISLSDISILTLEGGSPIGGNKTGLLAQGNSTIASQGSVIAEPLASLPYLYLWPSVCTAITSHLPVTYDDDTGLYLWNTDDPVYSKLIKSPTVLSFEFTNFEDNPLHVPFALLSLTLEGQIKGQPTAYFPCNPMNEANSNDYGVMLLGRSFLQAVYLGSNWTPDNPSLGKWFMAQAPGPKHAAFSSATALVGDSTDVVGTSDVSLLDSWSGYWTPLPDDNNGSQNSTQSGGGGGLSSGAKIGIGVGVAVGVLALLLVALLVFLYRRKRSKRASETANSNTPATTVEQPVQSGWVNVREKNEYRPTDGQYSPADGQYYNYDNYGYVQHSPPQPPVQTAPVTRFVEMEDSSPPMQATSGPFEAPDTSPRNF